MPIRLLHTADVHLDAPFGWAGVRGREQRRQLRETFRSVVDLAIAERVDAVLVAGDLFDSNAPSQETIDLVRTQLGRLRAPTLILPGTHDCLDAGSVYRRAGLAGGQVHVFGPEQTAVELPAAGLTVHGRANETKRSTVSPLAGLRRSAATPHHVALAHGSLARPQTQDDYPISEADLARSGMDYVALGHWHSCRDCSPPGPAATRAFYSGPPELLAADDAEQGYVLLVELGPAGTRVERRRVGRRRHERLTVSLDGVASVEGVREAIRARRDPDLALTVVLGGVRSPELALDPEDLAEEAADGFLALRVRDESQAAAGAELPPERSIAGEYARRLRARIAAASSPEERRLAEAALAVGLSLLQGKRVLR